MVAFPTRPGHDRSVSRWIAIRAALIGVPLSVGLVVSSVAMGAPDPLAQSSSVVLKTKSAGGLKLKPKKLSLPVNRGDLDPTTGAGTIETGKALKVRHRGEKTKVKIIRLIFGANGGSGRIDAKIGKHKVKGFGKLKGGTLTRDGWGAKLDGVSARLGKKGARALGAKAGLRLGRVAVGSVPKEVEVLPGGTLTFASDIGFAVKLQNHCVNAFIATTPAAVEPIAPATEPSLGQFVFPVTGGSIAPDLSSGKVTSAGGQKITKNDNSTYPGCASGPPIGTAVTQNSWEAEFDLHALATDTVLPAGPIGFGALGPFDLGAATVSADPATRHITITSAPVTMDPLSAVTFNSVFPRGSSDPNQDFKAGDVLGTMSLSVTTH